MRSSLPSLLLVALISATASSCGGDGGTGSNGLVYENLEGTYVGAISGDDQGKTLVANFTMELNQDRASVDGVFHWVGTLTDGDIILDVFLAGTLAGSVTPGEAPSVTLVATTPLCPGYSAQYSGTYDLANQTLSLAGPVDVLSVYCNVGATFDLSIQLERQAPVAQASRRPNGRLELDGRWEPHRP